LIFFPSNVQNNYYR